MKINATATTIAIQPFLDPAMENSGTENYGEVLIYNGETLEPLFIREINGVARAVNGLDEFSPEVQNLPADKKAARVKDIREELADIERLLFGVAPDPSIPKDAKKDTFWADTKIGPNNLTFYNGERFKLKLTNGTLLISKTDPFDRILRRAIESGGYSKVAPSLEVARANPNKYKWFLDVLETTSASNEEGRRIINKAATTLETLRDELVEKLILVARNIDTHPGEYKKSTPIGVVYNKMDAYIKGEMSWEKDKKRASQNFVRVASLSIEELTIRSIISVAKQYKFLDAKKDGYIYFMKEGLSLGRNIEEVYLALKNPKHEDIFDKLQDACNEFLNQ